MSLSAAVRSFSPILGSIVFSFGDRHDMVGLAWWAMMIVASGGLVLSHWVRDGSTIEPKRPDEV